jgi:hypothetical protein
MSRHLQLIGTTPHATLAVREYHGAEGRGRPDRARTVPAGESGGKRLHRSEEAVVLAFARASAEDARRRHPSRLARDLD